MQAALITAGIGIIVSAVIIGGFLAWLHMHDAAIVEREQAACTLQKQKMVDGAAYDALAATAARDRREAQAAASAAADAEKRATDAESEKEAALRRLASQSADAVKDKTLTSPSAEDFKWLDAH